MALRIAVIAGDGIGKEVTAEAVRVLDAVGGVDLHALPWGADHFLATGETVPRDGYEILRSFDAVLVGALGDPRVPDNRHARDILLGTRFELDLYVNYRPVRLLDERLSPLKGRTRADVNFVVFRENTEGLYVGVGGRFKAGTDEEIAVQEEINTFKGVNRIVRHAFEFARARRLQRVCMADKSNAMTQGHALWQRVFQELKPQYPDIQATHMYIDALAMFMVQNPGQFEVIVTNNLFGDIITDIGAAITGGIGLAASGNINPDNTAPSMFEPVHGSAPDIAGQGKADPTATVLSAAAMLDHLGVPEAARRIEAAVSMDLKTRAQSGAVRSTSQIGDDLVARVTEQG